MTDDFGRRLEAARLRLSEGTMIDIHIVKEAKR